MSVCRCPGLWTVWCCIHVWLTFMSTEIRSFIFVFVIRMTRDLPCFGGQQTSIKTCIVWPWLVLESTATFSASTLCPNTLVLTHHFLQRFDSYWTRYNFIGFDLKFLHDNHDLSSLSFSRTYNMFPSRCFQSPGSCPPARLHSSSWI